MDPSERAARQRHDVPPASIDCIDCIDSIEAPSPGSSVSAPNLVLEHDVRRRLLRRARRRRHAAAPGLVARRRTSSSLRLSAPSSSLLPARLGALKCQAGQGLASLGFSTAARAPLSACAASALRCPCRPLSPSVLPLSLSLSLSLSLRALSSRARSRFLSVLLVHTRVRARARFLQMASTSPSTSTSEAPSDAAVDYYELLEVDRSASTDDIRKSYGSRAGH